MVFTLTLVARYAIVMRKCRALFFFFFFFFFKGFGEPVGAFSLRYTIRVIISCLSTNETDVMAMLSLHRQSDFV